MFSYPNKISLLLKEAEKIKNQLDDIEFDTLYGEFDFQNVSKMYEPF